MVERFTIYASPGNDDHWIGHHETGEYTRYSDYAELERQIAELRAEQRGGVSTRFDACECGPGIPCKYCNQGTIPRFSLEGE